MKKLKSIIKLRNTFIDFATDFDKILQDADIITNAEHQKILLGEKLKLIEQICTDEKLDFELLKNKYLNITNDTTNITNDDNKIDILVEVKDSKTIEQTDILLNLVIINKIKYYYEPKENGNIYNDTSQFVGKYINSKFNFNK
jgi:hypothetical protein